MSKSKFEKGENFYGCFDVKALEALESELSSLVFGINHKLKEIQAAIIRKRYPTEDDFIKQVKSLVALKDVYTASSFVGMWANCSNQVASEIVSQIITEGLDKEAFDNELKLLISSGRKIDAIKKYRETYGVGLMEAKNVIEKMQDDMNEHLMNSKSDTDLLERLSNVISDIKNKEKKLKK